MAVSSTDRNKRLRQAGLKPTRHRLLVMDVLSEVHTPISASEIHRIASRRGGMDRVTVYRILDDMFEAGLVDRLKAGGRAWRYHLLLAPDRPRHPHFYCIRCKNRSCLDADLVSLNKRLLADLFPARVDHLEVSLEGVCPNCLASDKEEK